MAKTRRILVAPLDWGLGHATRCIPLIRTLLDLGQEVMLASSGGALQLRVIEYRIGQMRGGSERVRRALRLEQGDPIDVRPVHDEDGTIHAVPWSRTGVDNDVENRGLFGLGHTDEEVTVRGVTFVTRVPASDDNPDGYQLYRYIDWLDVFRQAGISAATRPIYDYRKHLSPESLDELNKIPELAEAYRIVAEREDGG